MTSPWRAALAEAALDCASSKKQRNKTFPYYNERKILLLLADSEKMPTDVSRIRILFQELGRRVQ